MSIAIAARDAGWVGRCNLQAQAWEGVPESHVPEWYVTDANYGRGCSVWEVDGVKILVARNLREALQGSVGTGWDHTTHHPLLYGYVDLYLDGEGTLRALLTENLGYESQHLRWLTPELAAPPINRMMPNG